MSYDDCNPPEIEAPDNLSDERLKPQIERLRSLRSAWGVLAPSCLTSKARKISETGRKVTELLVSLSGRAGQLDEDDLAAANHRLDAFEAMMQKLTLQVPVSQLRFSLPGLIHSDRQGLLDLLDTMIATTEESKNGLNPQIGSIDYLATLICTNAGTSGGQVRFDPVTLTSRMAALCESVDTADDPRLEEIEAEFFSAANMDRNDLREEMQQRTLRSRKAELGMAFFAPRILRAIVTYNASLYHRVADEILDSGDWGQVEQTPSDDASSSTAAVSVFECDRFRSIASALRRRVRGEQALPSDEDRIAWALDLDSLEKSELEALAQTTVGTSEDAVGTAILVGLLCRSLAVLSIELQALEIAPDLVSDFWVPELEAVFQEEINHKISNDAYKAACALSELKNKHLLAPLTNQYREQRSPVSEPLTDAVSADAPRSATPSIPSTPVAPATPRTSRPRPKPSKAPPKPETARDLVLSALEDDHVPLKQSVARENLFDASVLKAVGLASLVIALVVSFALMNRNPDLKSWSTAQLENVSPYLDSGRRNGKGVGTAFVGQIVHEWESLPRSVREASADDLVRRLREMGVEQIMVYGSDQKVRIQSIGSQPTQIR